MSDPDEPTWAAPAARFARVDDVTAAYTRHPYPSAVVILPRETGPTASLRKTVVVTQRPPQPRPTFFQQIAPIISAAVCFGLVAIFGFAVVAYAGVVPVFPAVCFAVGLLCIDVAFCALMVVVKVR